MTKYWELNYAPIMEIARKFPESVNYGHWLWRRAVLNPGEMHTMQYEENGVTYTYDALFDPVTEIMHTNLPGCPWRTFHHVGATCEVCGVLN